MIIGNNILVYAKGGFQLSVVKPKPDHYNYLTIRLLSQSQTAVKAKVK